jgi:hypothetical protein
MDAVCAPIPHRVPVEEGGKVMKENRTLVTMALVAITLITPAGIATASFGGHPGCHPNLSMKPGRLPILNNIVSMDEQGVKEALCPCGRRFIVRPESNSIDRNGTIVYVCTERCGSGVTTGSPESIMRWNRTLSATRLNTNVRMKQGFETATCPCGKTFVLVNRSRALADNGLIVFFCEENCRSRFRAMPPEQRMAAELHMLPPVHSVQPSAELTYCLLPTAEGAAQGCATVTYRLTNGATVIAAGPPNMR